MAVGLRKININIIAFILVLLCYILGQLFIGTRSVQNESFCFTAPADIDFLYYAGIINQLKCTFPPQNPAYGGIVLSQSFIQFYPTVIVSLIFNEYIAMRIMNIVYLVLLVIVIRRFYSGRWGSGLIAIAAGSIGFGMINSLGVDLIARGFNHFPFFIALLVALNEVRIKWLRYLCLLLLGWLHSYSALIILVYLFLRLIFQKSDRQAVFDILFGFIGVFSAAMLTLGIADKPSYFIFTEGFAPDLTNLWIHSLITIIPVILSGKRDFCLFYAAAFLFGFLFHYNPFFPVFLLYFVSGLALIDLCNRNGRRWIIAHAISSILFIGFIVGAGSKYIADSNSYFPHVDKEYRKAGEWLEQNTPGDIVLLTAPLDSEWRSRLMEKRALYLGFLPHVGHLGIDWQPRSQIIANYFTNPHVNIAVIDYVVYGPVERQYFPNFSLPYLPLYRDEFVSIWKVSK